MERRMELLKKNFELFKEDLRNETKVKIENLSIDRYDEKEGRYFILKSEFIDNQIGILSNSLKKVYVSLSVYFLNDNIISIEPFFQYSLIKGGENGIPILNRYQQRFVFQYEIKDNELYLIERKYNEGEYRIVISHTDNQLDSIYCERELPEWRFVEIISNECYIKKTTVYQIKNGMWEEKEI